MPLRQGHQLLPLRRLFIKITKDKQVENKVDKEVDIGQGDALQGGQGGVEDHQLLPFQQLFKRITKEKQVEGEVDKEVDMEFDNKVDKDMHDMMNLEVTIKGEHKTTKTPYYDLLSR